MELRLPAEDLKALEDTFARSVARGLLAALRTAARDGLLPWLTNGIQPGVPVQEDQAVINAIAGAQQPPQAAPPLKEPPVTVLPEVRRGRPPNGRPKEPKTKRTNTKLRHLLKTVATRPDGYIPTDLALNVVNLGPNGPAILRHWIAEKSVRAVIVADVTPPTKGMPGRLMVETASVRERNKLRVENSKIPPTHRRKPEILTQAM